MKKLLYLCLLLMLSTPLIADSSQEAVFKLSNFKIEEGEISGTVESEHPVVKKNKIYVEVTMLTLVNGVKTEQRYYDWYLDNGFFKFEEEIYLEELEGIPQNAKITYEFKVIGWHVVNKGKVKVIN